MRVALPGLSVADAKPLVRRNLRPVARRAAGQFRDDIENAAAELMRQPAEDDW
jgi:hypothetical protein